MTHVNTTYTEAYLEYGRAYFVALSADEQWQRELNFQGVNRYSLEACGVVGSGSALRGLYEAKLQADEELRNATDALKVSGTAAEVDAVDALNETRGLR